MSGRVTLNENMTIKLKNEDNVVKEYKIKRVLGSGASSVVYEVEYHKNGQSLMGVLKEFYPKSFEDYITRDGSKIVYNKGRIAELKKEEKYFKYAYDELIELKKFPSVRNYIVNPLEYLSSEEINDNEGTYYILSESVTGDILSNIKAKLSLKEIFEIALSLANALEEIHSLGRVYLDIKPDNLLVTPSKERRMLRLFDVDSMLRLDTLNEAGENGTSIRIAGSPSWCSPEQKEISIVGLNEETKKLIGRNIDYYQLGLVIKDLLGDSISSYGDVDSDYMILVKEEDNPLFKDVSPDVNVKVQTFLEKMLMHDVKKRYLDILQIKNAIESIIRLSYKKDYYIKYTPIHNNNKFIGREDKISDIDDIFDNAVESKVVYLVGQPGMGKSALAKRYAKLRKEERYIRTFYIAYESSIKYSLVNGLEIPGINTRDRDLNDAFSLWYSKASELISEEMLLVIDNMNIADKDVVLLDKLSCDVLITSRIKEHYGANNIVEIDEMQENDLKRFFKQESRLSGSPCPDDEKSIEKIIELFGKHTLAVELAARQMLALGSCPREYFERLDNGLSTINRTVNRDAENRTLLGHLELLFDIQELGEKEIELLKIMAVLPADGINNSKLIEYVLKNVDDYQKTDEFENTIDRLANISLLYQDGLYSNQKAVRVHPLMREFILESSELKPSTIDEYQKNYQESLINKFDKAKKYEDIKEDIELLRAYSSAVLKMKEEKVSSSLYISLATMLEEYSLYNEALAMYIYILELSKKINGDNDFVTAGLHNDLGRVYYEKDNYEESLESHKNAIDIYEEYYPGRLEEIAISYDYKGRTHTRKNNEYDEAMKCYNKALAIRDKIEKDGYKTEDQEKNNRLGIAQLYSDIANYKSRKGSFDEAIKGHKKALKIRKKFLDKNHKDIATTYNNLGNTYSRKEEYDKAIKKFNKALKIRRKLYGNIHKDTARTLGNIANALSRQNNYKEALETFEEVLKIRLSCLGNRSVDTSDAYNSIGNIYRYNYEDKGDIGNYETNIDSALRNYKESLKILEDIFLPSVDNHVKLATAYNNIGVIYYMKSEFNAKNKYKKARKYLEKALVIRESKDFLEKSDDILETYTYLAKVYYCLGNYDKALDNFNKAYEIRSDKDLLDMIEKCKSKAKIS